MRGKKGKLRNPTAAKARLSRRDFLAGAGVTVSGGLLAGRTVATAASPEETTSVVGPGAVPVTLRVNGKAHQLTLEPRVTLLDALRDHLDLTGAKKVCDRAACGTCTVLLDHKPVYACTVLAIESEGHEITTIEAMSQGNKLHPMMEAFVKHDAQQCGFCTPGFVMASIAFLEQNPNPTLEDVEKGLGGNLCRCGTYAGIRHAILDAARAIKGGPAHAKM
jgi:xanthine dehydrogenase YagT iron-sulfur-binding subunit